MRAVLVAAVVGTSGTARMAGGGVGAARARLPRGHGGTRAFGRRRRAPLRPSRRPRDLRGARRGARRRPTARSPGAARPARGGRARRSAAGARLPRRTGARAAGAGARRDPAPGAARARRRWRPQPRARGGRPGGEGARRRPASPTSAAPGSRRRSTGSLCSPAISRTPATRRSSSQPTPTSRGACSHSPLVAEELGADEPGADEPADDSIRGIAGDASIRPIHGLGQAGCMSVKGVEALLRIRFLALAVVVAAVATPCGERIAADRPQRLATSS